MSDRVHIVGGGLIGLGIAWRCLRQGRAVTVYERGTPGREASWAAAGMLAPHFEADFDDEAMIRLSVESQRLWPDFAAAIEADASVEVGYDAAGTLFVALDRDDEEEVRRWIGFARQLGLPVEAWDRDRCLDAEPLLGPRVRMAASCTADHQVDNRALVRALGQAVAWHGGDLRTGSGVARVEAAAGSVEALVLEGGERVTARHVVIAAGAWTRQIEGLGPSRPPIRPVKGQALALRPRAGVTAPRRVLRGTEVYLCPKPDRVVVGATTEEQGFDRAVTAEAVSELLQAAHALLPGTYEMELLETWSGFRPAGRDHGPTLGPADIAGLHYATGHYRHGVLLLPITVDAVWAGLAGEAIPGVCRPFGVVGRGHA
jgi:glycine oxidase